MAPVTLTLTLTLNLRTSHGSFLSSRPLSVCGARRTALPSAPRRHGFLHLSSSSPEKTLRRSLLRRLHGSPNAPPRAGPQENLFLEAEEEGSAIASENDVKLISSSPPPPSGIWVAVPNRYKLILTTSLAFVICNMDKVNLSIAIIPMSKQLDWDASTAGLIQSSFFWGYAMSQLPGGWFARTFTGEVVLQIGVFVWSLATAVVPVVASFIPGLLFSRFIVGLGEGVSPPAATDLIARTMPTEERSRAVAMVFSGHNVGSVVGLLLAPILIEHFGWEYVFYIFGIVGVIWCIGFMAFTEDASHLKMSGKGELVNRDNLVKDDNQKIPWAAFFKSPSVWAMIYTHFCGNWGHYCIMAWLPSYFSHELKLDLTNTALVSLLPPLGGMFVSGFAATSADYLIARGADITIVRKLCQTIAFLSPSACMSLITIDTDLSPVMTVIIITCGLALSGFALGGLYCTHQDISRKYASILLGITNTAGAIPGILGVYFTGFLLDQTHSWNSALFAPCIFFWLTGTVVWNLFASSKPQAFGEEIQ